MSRIFTIEGNFKQGGKWSQPDPSFKGEIAVEDDGDDLFSGYCDELYDSVSEDKTRYLFGFLVQNEEGEVEGAAFFKLSNDRKQAPLVYLVPSPKSGRQMQWGAMLSLFGGSGCSTCKARLPSVLKRSPIPRRLRTPSMNACAASTRVLATICVFSASWPRMNSASISKCNCGLSRNHSSQTMHLNKPRFKPGFCSFKSPPFRPTRSTNPATN